MANPISDYDEQLSAKMVKNLLTLHRLSASEGWRDQLGMALGNWRTRHFNGTALMTSGKPHISLLSNS
ncbi:hypothetical protein [Gymnodinialimonas ulvae]|uniref:hypothetical protein n=1 Tax=Gymnodinialimonas ulvae TaxID=3126504 RepID=UPI0030EF79E7